MKDTDILLKLSTLPDDLKKEVEDFIDFLKSRKEGKSNAKEMREPGLAKGLVKMSNDFDEPLDDFKDYM